MDNPIQTRVLDEVSRERSRQVQLGWTPDHDDHHTTGFIVALAAAKIRYGYGKEPGDWELGELNACGCDEESVRNGTRRQLLIEALACLVAEVERMDRREAKLVGLLLGEPQ